MAFNEHLADRVRQRLPRAAHIAEKKMMGGLIFMINGNMCLGVDQDKQTNADRLMVRVGKLPYEKLLQRKGSRPMDFTGKVMRGFLFVGPEGFDKDTDLDFWVKKALEFNRLLGTK